MVVPPAPTIHPFQKCHEPAWEMEAVKSVKSLPARISPQTENTTDNNMPCKNKSEKYLELDRTQCCAYLLFDRAKRTRILLIKRHSNFHSQVPVFYLPKITSQCYSLRGKKVLYYRNCTFYYSRFPASMKCRRV